MLRLHASLAFEFYAVTLVLAVAVVLTEPWTGAWSPLLTMLTPALAALIMLTWLAPEGPWWSALVGLGLTRPGLKGWLPAIAGPVLVFAVGLWMLEGAGVTTLAPPTIAGSLSGVPLNLLAALAVGTLFALAEEMGWRGYMLPRLLGLSVLPAMLLTGFLHGVWHLPLMLTTDHYHAEGNPLLVVPLFLATLTLAGLFYGWLRLWTGSVWPVALAHAAVGLAWNLSTEVMQTQTPLATEYLGGESGLLMIAGLLVADLVIIRRSPVFRARAAMDLGLSGTVRLPQASGTIAARTASCHVSEPSWTYRGGIRFSRLKKFSATDAREDDMGSRHRRRRGLGYAHLLVAALAVAASAASGQPTELEVAPIMVQQVDAATPLPMADGSVHLVYELLVVNQGTASVTLNALVVKSQNGTELAVLREGDLPAVAIATPMGGNGAILAPGQSSLIYLDVPLPQGAALPTALVHWFEASLLPAGSGGAAEPAQATFEAAEVPVEADPPRVIAAPVAGSGWVMFRVCCSAAAPSHRGTLAFPLGRLVIPERFAIDFVQRTPRGELFTGPGDELSSYVHWGAEVRAVADGRVVSARTDQPEQVPGSLPPDLPSELAGGNAVTVDIGAGAYAYYAHLQPGSVAVQAGDKILAGQVLGRIGNSGRTFGPHLHFHLMDDPDWQHADGVPFVLLSFEGQGWLGEGALAAAMQGEMPTLQEDVLTGPFREVHPVGEQVVRFGG